MARLIRPLAADGYRVLCPDMRGAGWSSAPDDRYLKDDMADDLAAVLDRLGVEPVRLVAHDWGGPVAMIMLLRHPEKVTGFFGLNTFGPWALFDLTFVRRLWRLWYQMPMVIPVVGPRVIGDPKGRYLRMMCKWVGVVTCPPTSTSTSGAWVSQAMRSPVRAGTARRRTANSCAGCVATTRTHRSMFRCGGSLDWMTRWSRRCGYAGTTRSFRTVRSRRSTALVTGSPNNDRNWFWTDSDPFCARRDQTTSRARGEKEDARELQSTFTATTTRTFETLVGRPHLRQRARSRLVKGFCRSSCLKCRSRNLSRRGRHHAAPGSPVAA